MGCRTVGYENVMFEKNEHIAKIILNRPSKLNSLCPDTMEELRAVIAEINRDEDIRAVILTGAGDKAFSTGFDMKATTAEGTVAWEKLVRANYNTFMSIWNLRIPTIAAVNGYAIAAGVSLAMICDVTIAAQHAVFGEPELRHFALSPLLILPWFGTNRKLIHYHYYTGDSIDAELAEKLGMVAKVVPADQLQAEAERMARRIAKVPPYPVQMTKESIRRTYEMMGMTQALDYHRVIDTLVLSAHGIEEKDELLRVLDTSGPKAFFEARDGRFRD